MISLGTLIQKQGNKCHYCSCDMCEPGHATKSATLEHLIDKWSSPNHQKSDSKSNLVAACYQCNNTRGAVRNQIARAYYKGCAAKKQMKLAVASTSSSQLHKLFGPVPQQLFN